MYETSSGDGQRTVHVPVWSHTLTTKRILVTKDKYSSIEDDDLRINGKITWKRGEKHIEWSERYMTAGGAIDDIRRARFCKEGDILSSAQALLKLREFGIARGRRKQFHMIKDILIS